MYTFTLMFLVDAKWSSWGGYGSCSKTCHSGTQTRSRSCSGDRYGGKKTCPGSSSSSRSCNVNVRCPCKIQSYKYFILLFSFHALVQARLSQDFFKYPEPLFKGSGYLCTKFKLNSTISLLDWTGDMSVRVCEGKSKVIQCSDSHQVIKLQDYFWGRTSKSYCRSGVDWFWSTSCRGGHGRIANRCHNRNKCTLEANNSWMNDDPCWGTPKYAYVKYRCYG